MQDLTARERLLLLHDPESNQQQSRCIPSGHMNTGHTHIHYIYTHMHHQPHRSQALWPPTRTQGASISSSWRFTSVNIYMYLCKSGSLQSCVQTFSLSRGCSLDPSLFSCRKHPLVQKVIWRAAPDDLQWWAPLLDHRADGSLGAALEGAEQGIPSLGVLDFGSHPPLCPYAPLG